MKRLLALAVLSLGVVSIATAAEAPPPSWPPAKTHVFISADTVTAISSTGNAPAIVGKQENFFARGAGVKFRMFAVDLKTQKPLVPATTRYAYVVIPGQPNLKLTYKQGLWSSVWTIPADYPAGLVAFRILVRTKTNRGGSFVQTPVAAAQLTVLP